MIFFVDLHPAVDFGVSHFFAVRVHQVTVRCDGAFQYFSIGIYIICILYPAVPGQDAICAKIVFLTVYGLPFFQKGSASFAQRFAGIEIIKFLLHFDQTGSHHASLFIEIKFVFPNSLQTGIHGAFHARSPLRGKIAISVLRGDPAGLQHAGRIEVIIVLPDLHQSGSFQPGRLSVLFGVIIINSASLLLPARISSQCCG